MIPKISAALTDCEELSGTIGALVGLGAVGMKGNSDQSIAV
jgi:hypothetical protein